MKKVIILLTITFTYIPLRAQTKSYIADSFKSGIPIKNNRIFFSEIDSAAGTKEELFLRAKSFLSKAYTNYNDIVKLDDKELGKITIRGFFSTPPDPEKVISMVYEFFATFTIEVRDGRYKYEISDFTRDNGYSFEVYIMTKNGERKASKKFLPYMESVIESLKNSMKNNNETW